MTQWVPVKGFENRYEVNRSGQVRRIKGKGSRSERLIGEGYAFLILSDGPRSRRVTRKELIAEHF